jgi:pimeloyl-ACP methyl ester carboxylesterase
MARLLEDPAVTADSGLAQAVFLPGILMPASVRYAPLIGLLAPAATGVPKELAVYARESPPDDYSIQTEMEDLTRFLDEHELDRVHLYGHSAGGCVALAYTAEHPARVLSLALDEPASDFSNEDRALLEAQFPVRLADMPAADRMRAFVASLVREGVQLPTPPAAPSNAETAKRPRGLLAFEQAMYTYHLNVSALGQFTGPVYFSYGTFSSARWEEMSKRVCSWFPRCQVDRYEGLHHLNTSHQAEPARVAQALHRLWSDSRPVTDA